jgi:hypothetical protein
VDQVLAPLAIGRLERRLAVDGRRNVDLSRRIDDVFVFLGRASRRVDSS